MIFRKVLDFKDFLIYQNYRDKYNLAKDFRFNGTGILFYGTGDLKIDKNSYVGGYSTIQINEGNTVVIGANCRISHNVRIYTSTPLADQNFNLENQIEFKTGNVNIGDGVWLGVNVYVGPGVNIGMNTTVGANSVVIKDLPPNSIVGGIPAKKIKSK
ncbi:acyltransferase [Leeuwenhoekiella sp. W20_SRS_FM14]|uniref:acyltransferase n=1 Tax=Leeuwenhoekiella sp. W20_SRS_FM14 TaxID=3240270 RepID=UPI003F97170E